MKNILDNIINFLIFIIVFLVIGIVVGLSIGAYQFEERWKKIAIDHDAAHWDERTGRFTWNDEPWRNK